MNWGTRSDVTWRLWKSLGGPFALSCSVILSGVAVREASGNAVEGPQQSKNHGDVSGSSPRQFGSTGGNSFRSWCRCWRVWDPSTARLLRIREAVASLRMTGVREFRANGAALPRRCWSRCFWILASNDASRISMVMVGGVARNLGWATPPIRMASFNYISN